MAIKKENAKVGIIDKESQPKKKNSVVGPTVNKRDKKQEGDGEAGVDPQQERINDMPEPGTFPREPQKRKKPRN